MFLNQIVCFNGIPLYETAGKSPSGSRAFGTRETRFKFAKSAIDNLKLNCSQCLVDGLVRVDIMQDDNGEMVVNEFESLEACHEFCFFV